MVDGQPDPALFSETIGNIIARAAEASREENRRVVAFGEMVALLWADGKSEAAIQLEKLWNQLAKTYSFSLHCAYPIQGFCREDMADSLLKICAEHTGVVRQESSLHSNASLQQDGSASSVVWDQSGEPLRFFIESIQ